MHEARIKDKIEEIKRYLNELGFITNLTLEDYKQNFEKKAACERYFEKIVEARLSLLI